MAKTKLKRMDRFELLELIYNMRKANLELTERLEAAEKKIEELKKEADQRVDTVRSEYTQRLDDLRMQGAAKDLQKRLSEIEEQLIAFQRIAGRDAPPEAAGNGGSSEKAPANAFTPPAAAPAEQTAPSQDSVTAAGEAGESGE